jgi:hypothetical protein
MSKSEWTDLRAITDRVGNLKFQAEAAAAAGDFEMAAHFFGLINRAEDKRDRILERLTGQVCGDS